MDDERIKLGIKLALKNAERLSQSANTLMEIGDYPSAGYLAETCLEEIAKAICYSEVLKETEEDERNKYWKIGNGSNGSGDSHKEKIKSLIGWMTDIDNKNYLIEVSESKREHIESTLFTLRLLTTFGEPFHQAKHTLEEVMFCCSPGGIKEINKRFHLMIFENIKKMLENQEKQKKTIDQLVTFLQEQTSDIKKLEEHRESLIFVDPVGPNSRKNYKKVSSFFSPRDVEKGECESWIEISNALMCMKDEIERRLLEVNS